MKITEIKALASGLPPAEKRIFRRIFRVENVTGRLKIPKPLRPWVKEQFGNLGEVEKQRIVKVVNKITFEGSLFNELRGKRPIQAGEESLSELEEAEGCFFCQPLQFTAEDVFGRIQGEHCITASNIAKYDAWHGLVIFSRHNPLQYSRETFESGLNQAIQWFQQVRAFDSKAKYPFLIWNCLWRGGASIVHGHFQMVMGRTPYPKIEYLWRCAKRYQARYGSKYFEDLYRVHEALGLGFKLGDAKVFASLTPIKEKEVIVFSMELESLKEAVYRVLTCYRRLQVSSFNLSLAMPPMAEVKGWKGFPYLARLVDRGRLQEKTSDIGGMELYAVSVVSSDPFKLAESLKEAF